MKHYIYLSLAILMTLFLCQCKSNCQELKKMPDSPISHLEYIKRGMRANPELEYIFDRLDDGRYLAKCTIYESSKSAYCDKEVADEIYKILKEGKIVKYKTYYRPRLNIKDGYTWSFKVKFMNGESINTEGHQSKPHDFSAVSNTLEKLKEVTGME